MLTKREAYNLLFLNVSPIFIIAIIIICSSRNLHETLQQNYFFCEMIHKGNVYFNKGLHILLTNNKLKHHYRRDELLAPHLHVNFQIPIFCQY